MGSVLTTDEEKVWSGEGLCLSWRSEVAVVLLLIWLDSQLLSFKEYSQMLMLTFTLFSEEPNFLKDVCNGKVTRNQKSRFPFGHFSLMSEWL